MERRAPAPESPASIPKRIASPRFGTTRGRRQCRFAKATGARSTARILCCGRHPSIPIVLGERPSRAHLEEDGRVLLHRHFAIDDKGQERMMIELRMTRK